ncbi:hypothetical protein KIF53_16825 [Chromobacterium subtsugae]|uniref:Uncharacterized protein n=1 Tax=Chromobacterium subtsugae TaxID=251747 RepID=A0ABS7FGT9_9NEIS|nr:MULTISPECIES: hypothetical protein [Chromobacterium]MBW7568187.1 hypothetical protein [Chromobacterium subtsugae]MBW8289298.1 hypothetical protein [Chromobacterium subtsugae]WSE90382.1 hypothetical protein U6115_15990 [Chromobacterium subtsugae]WVH58754.1 hypothetical protein U6151_16015 [Chromobacterium subtsugae]
MSESIFFCRKQWHTIMFNAAQKIIRALYQLRLRINIAVKTEAPPAILPGRRAGFIASGGIIYCLVQAFLKRPFAGTVTSPPNTGNLHERHPAI